MKDNEEFKFKIESWDDLKDNYFKIYISSLDRAIELMKLFGISIITENNGYWLEVNKNKKEYSKSRIFAKENKK